MGETGQFGTLEPVDVRQAWRHEAQDFTPWLAANLDQLASVLGVELECENTEVRVGPYRADIVARIPQNDTRVLVENQLGDADLRHLGQLLAYLAGLEAEMVVWVATGFDEAHRSAIRWLNEHTADPFAFFAVRLELVRIDDSRPAPIFDVIERPNEWDRQVQSVGRGGALSDTGKFRRDFWAHFAMRISDAPGLRPGYAGSNVWHRIEGMGLTVVQFLARDRVGVYLIGEWGEPSATAAPRIEPYATSLRKALPDDRITDHCLTERLIDSRNRSNWDEMADWLNTRRRIYERVLAWPDE